MQKQSLINKAGGATISIYRERGALYIERNFLRDSGRLKDEAVERPSQLGRRFGTKDPSDHGDYYLVDPAGNLKLYDRQGFIRTAKKLGER